MSTAASLRMAGIRVGDGEVAALLAGESLPLSDAGQIRGYAGAIEQGLPSTGLLSPLDLRRIHHVLMGRGATGSGESPWRTAALHREEFDEDGRATGRVFPTLPPRLIAEKTEQLSTWLEYELRTAEQHPVLVVAAFVLGLLSISPFDIGNGRLGRLSAGLLLDRAGYEFLPYSSLETGIEQRRQSYYNAIDGSQTRLWTGEADLSPWIEFFVDALSVQREALERRLDVELTAGELPPLQQAILDAAREHGTVDAGLLLAATGANRNTLKDNLRRMVERGVLRKTGTRRGTRYMLAGGEPLRSGSG